jgi:quinol monooxygenase YgiN
MIIVTGSLLAKPGCEARLLELGLEHVRRSRREPGCISHAVHRDAENPLRLVFVEEWADRGALIAHFAVPGSREFVRAAGELAAASPQLRIYEAQEIQLLSGAAPITVPARSPR